MNSSQNLRNFGNLQRSSKIFRTNTPHQQCRTPFRLQSNRGGDKIEQEIANVYNQPMKISHLVRPFVFTVGVSACDESRNFGDLYRFIYSIQIANRYHQRQLLEPQYGSMNMCVEQSNE